MSFSNFSMKNLAGNSKLPRLNPGGSPGGSPGPAILVFMGMAGGAYYLYKQKGADNPPRIPDSNPGSVAKRELPEEPDHPRLQDYLKFHPMAGFRVAQDLEDLAKDQKDLTKDQKDLTKDQKDLTKDQKDLAQDQKNLTKDEDLIIALAFKD
jgi:hypothetical protein